MTRRPVPREGASVLAARSNVSACAASRRIDPAAGCLLLVRIVLVVCVALGFYWRTAKHEFVYVDDDRLIVQQQQRLTEVGALRRAFEQPYFQSGARDHAYYRPIVTASYILDAVRSNGAAKGFHRTNTTLHAIAAGLFVFWLFTRTGSANLGLIGGLAFALHPSLVEAVAWIPGRPDLLMTIFVLGAWILHGYARNPRHWFARIMQPCLWFLALLCKEAALLMPIVWWFEDYLSRDNPPQFKAEWWQTIGWGGALGTVLLMRMHALPLGLGVDGISPFESIKNSLVLVSSLGKCLLPLQLSVLAIPEDTWLWPGVIVGAAMVWLWVSRVSVRRDLVWGLAAYFAVMIPSLPATNALILECRLYLPTVVLLALVLNIAERLRASGPGWSAISLAIVVLIAVRSNAYLDVFRDRQSFAEAAVLGSPHSALAHRNLGVALHRAGNVADARRAYETAVRLDDDEPIVHNNLGVIFMAEGKLVDAERELRRELDVNPVYADAHHNLAMVLHATGRDEEASVHWRASLAANSKDTTAMRALHDFFRVREPEVADQFRHMLENHRKLDTP